MVEENLNSELPVGIAAQLEGPENIGSFALNSSVEDFKAKLIGVSRAPAADDSEMEFLDERLLDFKRKIDGEDGEISSESLDGDLVLKNMGLLMAASGGNANLSLKKFWQERVDSANYNWKSSLDDARSFKAKLLMNEEGTYKEYVDFREKVLTSWDSRGGISYGNSINDFLSEISESVSADADFLRPFLCQRADDPKWIGYTGEQLAEKVIDPILRQMEISAIMGNMSDSEKAESSRLGKLCDKYREEYQRLNDFLKDY